MGPKSHFLYSLFFVLILVTGHVKARDSQFFSKVTRLDSTSKTNQQVAESVAKAPTASANGKEEEEEEDDEPVFIPQIGHTGYGLYGADKTSSSSEHSKKSEESDEVKFYRNYYSGVDNSNENQQNTMLYGDSNMERYQQQQQLTPRQWNARAESRNYNNNNNNNGEGLSDTTRSRYFYNSEKPAVGQNYYYNHHTAVDEQQYPQQYNQNGMQSGSSQFDDEFNFNP